jgi:hypothetical protein
MRYTHKQSNQQPQTPANMSPVFVYQCLTIMKLDAHSWTSRESPSVNDDASWNNLRAGGRFSWPHKFIIRVWDREPGVVSIVCVVLVNLFCHTSRQSQFVAVLVVLSVYRRCDYFWDLVIYLLLTSVSVAIQVN